MSLSDVTHSLEIYTTPQARAAVEAWLLTDPQTQSFGGFVAGSVDFPKDLQTTYQGPIPEASETFSAQWCESPFVVYRYERGELQSLESRIRGEFAPNQIRCDHRSMPTADWSERWKESFEPFAIGSFLVAPPWKAPTPDQALTSGEGKRLVPLIVEPAMAFGTGHHASTRLCLRLMEQHFPMLSSVSTTEPRKRALDVGTGSGILAVAAAKLGFAEVFASDIDSDAVTAAGLNAQINACNLSVHRGTFPELEIVGPKSCDLIVANILRPILIDLAPELVRRLADPQGVMILAGLLESDRSDILAAFEAQGTLEVTALTEGDWLGLALQRRG